MYAAPLGAEPKRAVLLLKGMRRCSGELRYFWFCGSASNVAWKAARCGNLVAAAGGGGGEGGSFGGEGLAAVSAMAGVTRCMLPKDMAAAASSAEEMGGSGGGDGGDDDEAVEAKGSGRPNTRARASSWCSTVHRLKSCGAYARYEVEGPTEKKRTGSLGDARETISIKRRSIKGRWFMVK